MDMFGQKVTGKAEMVRLCETSGCREKGAGKWRCSYQEKGTGKTKEEIFGRR